MARGGDASKCLKLKEKFLYREMEERGKPRKIGAYAQNLGGISKVSIKKKGCSKHCLNLHSLRGKLLEKKSEKIHWGRKTQGGEDQLRAERP